MEKLNKLGIGAVGLVGAEMAPVVQQVAELPVSELMKAITQIAIAVATIISLFRKQRKVQ